MPVRHQQPFSDDEACPRIGYLLFPGRAILPAEGMTLSMRVFSSSFSESLAHSG
jgi:hypothetical protein